MTWPFLCLPYYRSSLTRSASRLPARTALIIGGGIAGPALALALALALARHRITSTIFGIRPRLSDVGGPRPQRLACDRQHSRRLSSDQSERLPLPQDRGLQ